MRVAMVGAGRIPIPPPGYGAVEKHVWNLSLALKARGHDVEIVNEVLGESPESEYRFALRASCSVKRLGVDVVHVHTPGVATVFSLIGPRRFVFTTHSRHWVRTEGLREKAGFALERRAVVKAARVIAVSPEVAAAAAGAGGMHVDVIPNGVDVVRFAPAWERRTGSRVAGLGEIARHKQWHVAARALRDIGCELVLVGPVRDRSYATELANEGSHVRIRGSIDEDGVVEHLATADFLVHPSVSESFGMAVLEGMSCGLPVVASDILSSLVEDGRTGFLIPTQAPHDVRVQKLREAARKLLAAPDVRRRLGEAGRATAVERHSWPIVAERVEAVYRKATSA